MLMFTTTPSFLLNTAPVPPILSMIVGSYVLGVVQ